jgi:predicted nucleotidyltransferase
VAGLLRHRSLLERLLRIPGREFTVRELSMESGVPYATTWRTVNGLLALGVLRERRVGAARVVSLNTTSPLLPELKRIVSLRLRPHRGAALLFARRASRLREVRRIILFGSASRGTSGPGSDVDVAVVLDRRTDRTMDRLLRMAAEVQDEAGLRVVPIAVSPGELGRDSRLARDLRAGEVLYDRP